MIDNEDQTHQFTDISELDTEPSYAIDIKTDNNIHYSTSGPSSIVYGNF